MSASAWRTAGLTYLKYSEACAHAVRNGLKEELRQVALRRSENVVRYAKWEQGKPSESKWAAVQKKE